MDFKFRSFKKRLKLKLVVILIPWQWHWLELRERRPDQQSHTHVRTPPSPPHKSHSVTPCQDKTTLSCQTHQLVGEKIDDRLVN